ncbi:MAG: DUF4923 family protein [Prevotellaceae bacterium]|jgi:acyl CoA:acetate/3-ketoacid CoA transferase beta subunit|nr:DUF4923 family protein [Prevotellaceae bacterium]
MTDDEDTIPQSIVGTWKYNRSDFIFKSDIAEIRNAINQMVNSGDPDISENPHSVTFNEDNSFEWIEGGNSRFWGTYSYSNGNRT